MVSAILDLEAAIEAWASDTDENDNSDRARAVLRGLVVRLGKSAESGLSDPADRLRPAVEPLITLRAALRTGRQLRRRRHDQGRAGRCRRGAERLPRWNFLGAVAPLRHLS